MPDLQTNTACRNNPGSSVVQQECPLGCLEVHVVAVLDVPGKTQLSPDNEINL